MKLWKSLVAILLSLMILLSLLPLTLGAEGLPINTGFNNPFNDIPDRVWRDQSQKIADGWQPFYIEETTYPGSGNASKLRWMSSAQFAAAFNGIDYKIEGDQSQSLWSSYDFEGGVYQQITGTIPGQVYGFDIGIVTYWRGPAYDDTDGKMVRQVGIDPFGGTDPTSENIIWSDTDANDKKWVYMDVAAVAQAMTMTMFAKVQAPENDSFNHTDLNMVYFDAAHIDLAPTTAINIDNNETTIEANWVGVSAPGWSIKGFEVQYRNKATTDWVSLQDKNSSNTATSFEGEAGQTYVLRVRPWQRTSESYESEIDMPGVWTEAEVTIGNAVAGQVFNHAGIGLVGVTISAGGNISTTSNSGGHYLLPTGGSGQFSIAATSPFSNLSAPPPVTVSVSAEAVTALNLTLRPTGDQQALTNNDFETDLTNWSVNNDGAAAVSTVEAHSGQRSLLISNAVEISQTNPISGMLNPLLSFWRKNDAPFTAHLLAGSTPLTMTAVQTQTLAPVETWTFTVIEWGRNEIYTGTVGAAFIYEGGPGANIFIDEVSLAAGFRKIYLPVVIRDN